METTPKEAYVYQTESGRCPYEEWLEALKDIKGCAKIRAKIARVRAGSGYPTGTRLLDGLSEEASWSQQSLIVTA